MIRTFQRHIVRKQMELSESLWQFEPCSGPYGGQRFLMAVPGCWESHPLFADYRGEGIYRKRFQAEGDIQIECKGVSHTAVLVLDGKQIAQHYNAYTPFSVVVKDLAKGEHLLEIKVDNRFHENSALHLPNDYMSYGGISRGVMVEQLQSAYFEYAHVKTIRKNDRWFINLKAAISVLKKERLRDKKVIAKVTIDNQTFEWNIRIDEKDNYELNTVLEMEDVLEWNPESPNLYQMVLQLFVEDDIIDDLIERFGFREVRISENNILLNGKKLRIKGVCRHEDHPDYGCALPYGAIYHDLVLIQQMGANSIRTVHYPNDEIFLDLCDEMGILVWEENHARGIEEEQMKHPLFEIQAENVIKEMIAAHYNHPSIFIWGILNECASETLFGRECYKKQFELIRQMDDTRPCTFASCKFFQDICFDLPDVVSCNIYPRWYVDQSTETYMTEIFDWIEQDKQGKDKPFLVSEIGAGAIYGYHNQHQGKWTEEYQMKALNEQISTCLQYDGCSGVYIWQFCDNRVSKEWFANRPREMNNKGIVDEYRREKMSYAKIKEIYGQYGNYFD